MGRGGGARPPADLALLSLTSLSPKLFNNIFNGLW